ncbi:MAG TPA: serine hydrolase domain-containing protein [Chitinophaga sp.]|uniref:serine hydrolase domain-containing protein n=1 Tax=Chitinophaga sp. TaxID=1869181 RepID=UPI002D17DA26|nr:serine hydrolase domain-containing protein [Chitinophaga sp.]HVI43990.1 serine hydrolase domain-containing protein [Chitinophaga sp.]
MKKLPLLLLSAGIIFCACKKDETHTSPAFSAVDKVLNDSVPTRFNGRCYVEIHVNGKTVYSRQAGGYNASTRLLIASCSKWLSAAVLMSLVDEGKLKLTDSVGKFLPIFTTYGKGKISIAQLFSHTSGFPGNSSQGYESDVTLTLTQAVDNIAKNVALESQPGTRFYYGGISMQIAGRICEVVSGKSWGDLAQQKIFSPCGMTDTDYGLTSNPIIAGGARSTPADYMRFLDMLMNKGVTTDGKRVLTNIAVDAMEQSMTGNVTVAYSPYPLNILNTPHFYGIGNWRDLTTADGTLMENSSPGAFGSHPWINRSKKITGFVFTFIANNGAAITLPTCLTIRKLVREQL